MPEEKCDAPVGSRPWWMSEYQWTPCRCARPKGHEPFYDHQCKEHDNPADAVEE